MSDRWNLGLTHYSRRNYYAARDLWELESKEVLHYRDACRVANGLAAAAQQIYGPTAARIHLERAYALSQRTEVDTSLRAKLLNNIGVMLCSLGHVKDGVQFCRAAFTMIDPNLPSESFYTLNGLLYTLNCADAYQEVWELRNEFEKLSEKVSNPQLTAQFSPYFYVNVSVAAERLGQYNDALGYAIMSCGGMKTSPNIVYVVELLLLQNRIEEAMEYISYIYHLCFDVTGYRELNVVARALEVLGRLADISGNQTLSKRAIEKAEMYFGQLGKWDDWLKMRDYQFGRTSYPIASEVLRVNDFYAFLDDLTLIDGMKLMFPDLFRMSQLATDLGIRVYQNLNVIEDDAVLRNMYMAGRLAYIGLNSVAVSESDAKDVLRSDVRSLEMTDYGLRLLESYPHTRSSRALVEGARSVKTLRENSCEMRLAAQCLGIAFQYVEKVELHHLSHDQAIQAMGTHNQYQPDGEVFTAFLANMTLDGVGKPT